MSDYLAQDEEHALYIARQIVAQLNYAKKTPLPKQYFEAVAPPLYDPGTTSPLHSSFDDAIYHLRLDEILGIVGGDIRVPFDSREIIARHI